jgi:hypothetical protein
MVDEDYSLDRLIQRARVASPTGEVSPAIRKRRVSAFETLRFVPSVRYILHR